MRIQILILTNYEDHQLGERVLYIKHLAELLLSHLGPLGVTSRMAREMVANSMAHRCISLFKCRLAA